MSVLDQYTRRRGLAPASEKLFDSLALDGGVAAGKQKCPAKSVRTTAKKQVTASVVAEDSSATFASQSLFDVLALETTVTPQIAIRRSQRAQRPSALVSSEFSTSASSRHTTLNSLPSMPEPLSC